MHCLIRRALPVDAQAISNVVIAALRESNARDYAPQVISAVEQHFCPTSILNLMSGRMLPDSIRTGWTMWRNRPNAGGFRTPLMTSTPVTSMPFASWMNSMNCENLSAEASCTGWGTFIP